MVKETKYRKNNKQYTKREHFYSHSESGGIMLKKLLRYKFHVIPFFNPLIQDEINRMENYCGVNKEKKRERSIIVSLTSYRERFKDLPITLYSLLNQSLKPDKIILWLNRDTEDLTSLPYNITKFIKNGLEIKFVRDIKSYTKVIYALKDFPDSIIVTADDDIYYRKDWLKKLYLSYVVNPEDIHVHRAHRVKKNTSGEIISYEKWNKYVKEELSGYDNFLTGVGGVLYPPKCFSKEVLRDDIFLKYAPTADDIWLWVMALTHGRKIRVVLNHDKSMICTNIFSHLFGHNLYNKNSKGGNDTQLKNLMKLYGQNVISKI